MRTLWRVSVVVAFVVSASLTRAAPEESPVRGLYNWIHSTGDAERSFSVHGATRLCWREGRAA
jgi:hypothetical protein